MHYVYILKSKHQPDKLYIGLSSDVQKRLREHNDGESRYTNMFRPWNLVTYLSFESKKKAEDFERYLKTGSGVAFMRKRLID